MIKPGRSCAKILITGASGALGPRVVRAFSDEGYAIRTFSLDPAPGGTFPPGFEIMIGDVTDNEAVASAMMGVDYVVHMAALLHIDNPSPAMLPRYRRINVDGTNCIVQAALRENVERIIFLSTIAVYGPGNGKIYTEKSSTHPDTMYADTKLEGENIVLAAKRADGLPLGTVLRLGAVYGPGVKGNYRRLVQALARRRFIPIGKGKNRRTLVYDRDVAMAVLLAVKNPIAAGRIYNVTDGRIYSMKEIIEVLCGLLGRRVPRIALPEGFVRSLATGMEAGLKVFGKKSPISRTMIDKYVEDMAVNGERIQTELGFIPRYDLFQGWSEVVEEMRFTGDL